MSESAIRGRISTCSGWSLQRQLGRGQYGTAYLVEWKGLPPGLKERAAADPSRPAPYNFRAGYQAVAKVVGLEFLPDKEHTLARQEVDLMRTLRHPHIVTLVDHFQTEANVDLVLVMEFCDGGDLRAEVKRRASAKPVCHIPEGRIMLWFVQLTQALNYMHQRHVLHRDLKSSNIFLIGSTQGAGVDVKIGDFGISRVLDGTVDVAATVVGTPYYMSPEVCKAEPYGYKSDIWALGCVLYEMCMLKHAFESGSLLGLVYKIVSDTYDAIPNLYSDELRSLLERILDKSQYTRPDGHALLAEPFVRRFMPGEEREEPADALEETSPMADQPEISRQRPKSRQRQPTQEPQKPAQQEPQQQQPEQPPPQPQQPQQRRPPVQQPEPQPQKQEAQQQQPPQLPPKMQQQPSQRLPPQLLQQHEKQQQRAKQSAGLVTSSHVTRYPGLRMPENSPVPPETQRASMRPSDDTSDLVLEEPVARRHWSAVGGPAPAAKPPSNIDFDECELRIKILLRRIQLALSNRRQNWLLVFAHFNKHGNGMLLPSEFERAVTSMALGLSDAEIREVRICLQGDGECVPVDTFGASLFKPAEEVLRHEGWGHKILGDLTREAALAENANGAAFASLPVAPGAAVRLKNLTSPVGIKLNGAEGVVDSWDPQTSRWTVKLGDGMFKTMTDANLEVIQPAMVKSGSSSKSAVRSGVETAAIYRRLCAGGETAVPEERFLAVVRKLLPDLSDAERRDLLLMLPKTPDGRVDVPEVLAQYVTSSPPDKGRGLGKMAPAAAPKVQTASKMLPGPEIKPLNGHARASNGFGGGEDGASLPGAVPDAAGTAQRFVHAPSAARGSNGSPDKGKDRFRAEVALLRLAQRLQGKPAAPGPGLDVLRLFASSRGELTLEDLLDAVSVLPLGISRSEVQMVFAHVSESDDRETLPFDVLVAAAEAACSAGVPAEAVALEHLDTKKIISALQRLGATAGENGSTSPQDFKVSLQHAEPYLTRSQLESLMLLTDKDGEGGLLPRSLLIRLGVQSQHWPSAPLWVPPRPCGCSSGPVAASTPRPIVTASILCRMRDRLFAAGPQLTLEHIFGLFDLAPSDEWGVVAPRDQLASLLGQLRLGISAAEADELVSDLAQAGSCSAGQAYLGSLYEAFRRAGEHDTITSITDMREAAKECLQGQGDVIASFAQGGGEWIEETAFRRSLHAAMADEQGFDEDLEGRFVLLADKDVVGRIRWRDFAETYAGWVELSSTWTGSPASTSHSKLRTSNSRIDVPSQPYTDTGQSWRQSTQPRMRAPPSHFADKQSQHFLKASPVEEEPSGTEFEPSPRGPCRCLTRIIFA